MSERLEAALNRLLRGIATDHVETVRDAWRELRSAGDETVPRVVAKLDSDVWGKPPKGPAGRYLGILLALLSELDGATFGREVTRLRAAKLHPMHARTVALLAGRMEDNAVTMAGPGVPVYVARDLERRGKTAAEIVQWSQTPGLDLSDVTRIDVIGRVPGMDYLGRYNLFFSGIILVWPGVDRWPQWFRRLNREFTFYHEVGHHVCGHLEGGQVTEQEHEADEYGRKMMRAAHPVLVPIVRFFLWPLIAWARGRRRRQQERRG